MKNQRDYLKERMSRITDSIEVASSHPRLGGLLSAVEREGAFGCLAEKGIEAQILLNFKNTVMDKITDSAATFRKFFRLSQRGIRSSL